MSKTYWEIIAAEILDLGWCCDCHPVETPDNGVLTCAYAEKGEHYFFAQAETKLTAFMELQSLIAEHLKAQ